MISSPSLTLRWPAKDPDAVLDYSVDWTDWLDGDTISTSAWTVPSGITQTSASTTTLITTIWLSGGSGGRTYEIKNRIVTAAGRTEERTIRLPVRTR